MSDEARWQPYRHKEKPEIEYYVEEETWVRAAIQYKKPRLVATPPNGNYVVKIKCPRNAAFPQHDYPTIETMPPGPDMPADRFLELYERVS